jgi:hypothetical protein
MRLSGSAGSEDRNKMIAVAVFVVIAAGVLYYELKDVFFTPTPAPVAAVSAPQTPAVKPASGNNAKLVMTSAALDPTLHMDAMLVSESLEYSGSGRNIFSMTSAPANVIPQPISKARMTPPAPPPVVQPCPPNCPPPPPPPPIDLKFFGVASANGLRQAFLLHDDNVYLASAGDTVLRRYRVISIDAKSIQIEDMQNHNTQTLPLLAN